MGDPEGGSVMGDMMEDMEVEEREEDEESVGEEEGEGSEEGEGGEEIQVGEEGDDKDYEREDPPPSDIDDCDWTGL